MSKVIDEVVLKKAITEVLQVVADNTFDFVEYDDDSINALFDVESPEKLAYYESLINPDLVSENRLWSSKTIADKIAEAIVESNSYADGLITNITSIQLEWCSTSLPVTGETNKIYILPVASGSDTVNTLNIWNATTSAYVSIGNLEIDLSQYYTSSQVDTKLADKANSSEVLAVDKVQTTTGSETNDTVYSSKLTKDELDKKVNVTDIATTISSTPSDDKVASEKAVSDAVLDTAPFKFGIDENGNYGYYKAGADTVTPFKSSVELEDTGKIYGNRGRIKLMKMGSLRYFDSITGDIIDVGLEKIVLDEEDRPLSNTTIKCRVTTNGKDWTYGTLVIGTDGKFTSNVANGYYFSFANCHWIAKS